MRDLFTMWANTRMIVLMALTAALYAAVLIPFKGFVIIPQLTEVRPAAAIPVVCGMLFGPAACWGSALGNLIADVVGGMFGPGSLFGFLANFMYAYVPYKLGEALRLDESGASAGRRIGGYMLCCLSGSAACALVAGWGVDLLGFVPFTFLSLVIFVNNSIASLVLGPPLLAILQPRVKRWELSYRDILELERRPSLAPAMVLVAATLGGFLVLNLTSLGFLQVTLLDPAAAKGVALIRNGGAGFLTLMIIAMLLL